MAATLEIRPRRGGLIIEWRERDLVLSRAELAPYALPPSLAPLRGAELQAVFTPPGLRRQGHARRLLTEAAAWLERLDVDVGVLTCRRELCALYGAGGWQLVGGEGGAATGGTAHRMVQLCSALARERCEAVVRGWVGSP